MKRALVIGGGGYIGNRLTSRLLNDHWHVTSVELQPRDQEREQRPGEIERLYGSRDDEAVLSRALASEPDVVFDLIAYRPAESQAIIRLGAGRLGRLVHLSTVSVYREFPSVGRATEQTALRFDGIEHGYGPRKAACERALEAAGQTGFPYVIVRAAQIMGPGDPCSRQGYLVRRIVNSQTILHPGPEDGFLWLLFIDDLIDGLICAGTAPVLGRVFHLAQQDAPTLIEHVEELARTAGRSAPRILSLGVDRLIEAGFRIHGFAFARTVAVAPDTSAAQEALGWQCTPRHQAIIATIADLLGGHNIDNYPAWPGRETTQARLSGVHEWIHASKEARVLAELATEPGPYADAVLSWFADEPFGASRPELIESELWMPFLTERSLSSCSAFVTAPKKFIDRIASSGGTWRPLFVHRAKESCSPGGPNLVATLEIDKWVPERAWIFTSSPPCALPHYGLTSEPQKIDLVSFAEGIKLRAGPEERFLLEIRHIDDAEALAVFLRGCSERGSLEVEDLASWGRLYIVGASSWLPSEMQHRFEVFHPSPWQHCLVATNWVLTHTVARLLFRAGLEGAATITMGCIDDAEKGANLPVTAALCRIGSQTIVADLATDRVIEIAPAIAEVLSNLACPTLR